MDSLPDNRSDTVLKLFFPRKLSAAGRRRAHNIQLIVGRLAQGDLSAEEIHDLLACSMSGSRKYLRELQMAGLVQSRSIIQSKGLSVTRYTLDADPVTIRKILDWEPNGPALHIEIRQRNLEGLAPGIRAKPVSVIKVFRDPLVTALFGPPRLRR